MANITTEFGSGGSNLVPGASGEPSLATALRDIATDLETLNGGGVAVGAITAPALAAFTDPPSAAEMNLLRVLVNQIRARLIGAGSGGAGALLTKKV